MTIAHGVLCKMGLAKNNITTHVGGLSSNPGAPGNAAMAKRALACDSPKLAVLGDEPLSSMREEVRVSWSAAPRLHRRTVRVRIVEVPAALLRHLPHRALRRGRATVAPGGGVPSAPHLGSYPRASREPLHQGHLRQPYAEHPQEHPTTAARSSCGSARRLVGARPPLRAKLTAFAQSVLSPTKASLKPDAASELGLTSPKERLGLEGASEGPTSVNDLLFVRYVLATVSKRSAGEDCLCEWVDSAAMARTRLQV